LGRKLGISVRNSLVLVLEKDLNYLKKKGYPVARALEMLEAQKKHQIQLVEASHQPINSTNPMKPTEKDKQMVREAGHGPQRVLDFLDSENMPDFLQPKQRFEDMIKDCIQKNAPSKETASVAESYSRSICAELSNRIQKWSVHSTGIHVHMETNPHISPDAFMHKYGPALDVFCNFLSSLSERVFGKKSSMLNVFVDSASPVVAFYQPGTGHIFFNFRFFLQVHEGKASSAAVRYWFLVFCHELSHSVSLNHDLGFVKSMQTLLELFLPNLISFLGTSS
jgi:hypothetical protein